MLSTAEHLKISTYKEQPLLFLRIQSKTLIFLFYEFTMCG